MTDNENTEIVRTILILARNLGMDVVAEGVETEAQLTHLKSLNCQYGQGYLISRALRADAAEKFFKKKPNRVNSLYPSPYDSKQIQAV